MLMPQVLLQVKPIFETLNHIFNDEAKELKSQIEEIYDEISKFNSIIRGFIETKIKDIRDSLENNTNNNFTTDIYTAKQIIQNSKNTRQLVLKLIESSNLIKKESSESEELLSYLKAIEEYLKLFDKDCLKKYIRSIKKSFLFKLEDFLKNSSMSEEISKANQYIRILEKFKKEVDSCYQEINIKRVDVRRDLSNNWILRKSKKIYYEFNKNPLKMMALLVVLTTLLLGLTTLLIGIIIIFNKADYSEIGMYIKYKNLPKKRFFYSTVPTWHDINTEITNSKEYADIKLIPVAFNPRSAITDLISDRIDLVQSISPLTNEQLKQAADRKIKLKEIKVGYYLIAIAVNKDLNVNDITIPELYKIYTGQITNWKYLNGPDVQIKPYVLQEDHPNTLYFKKLVLREKNFGHQVTHVSTNTEAIQMLKQKGQGGIYFGVASEIVDQCLIKVLSLHSDKKNKPISPFQEIGTDNTHCSRKTRKQSVQAIDDGYILYQPINLIYKEEDKNNSIGDFYNSWFRSKTGQKLIKKAYFIPYTPTEQ